MIHKARKGDQKAMFFLYQNYVKAIYNIAFRMVLNKQDAEDIVQETFISAFNNLSSFRGDTTFGGWLKKIVVNRSLNCLRGRQVMFKDFEDQDLFFEEDYSFEADDIPTEEIHEAIKQLPDKARVILNMYIMEGYRHKDIASILDISESTSKSQYTRAKMILKEKLKRKVDYGI